MRLTAQLSLSDARSPRAAAFSLIEVMVVSGLMVILVVSLLTAVLQMDQNARRSSDYNSLLELAQGQLEMIRTNTYSPPTAPFGTATNFTTNITSTLGYALTAAGTNYQLTATNVTTIQTVAEGHLVTVTLTVPSYGKVIKAPLQVQVQAVMNRFSPGQP
ncbi:MAG: hypothetical protein HZA89_09850 [Verrucomicrobia bacterium]|nr:hypothetical protein [Verrucomicrobiota bacterium]